MKNLVAALPQVADQFFGKVKVNILNPIIALLFAVALLTFFWGVFKYIMHADDETERQVGGRAMVYGLIGIFVIVSVFGIVNFIIAFIQGF